jgi:enoyl-CoA hydratase/carnithine racemase
MSLWSVETRDGGVVVARYDHPPMNYFCAEGAQQLAALIESWRDPGVRGVVLAGGGDRGAFITHYSVEELLAAASDREAMRIAGTSLTRGYHALLWSLRELPKPVVVAMNGNTMGGGLELSLACDVRVGQHGDFRYGFPEVRLGIIPGGSGTQRLSRLIGPGRAVEFILRSRVVAPEVALELGIVHELAADAAARATEIAEEMAALPPRAIAAVKRSVYSGSDTHLQAGLEIESACFLDTMLSDDGVRAMQAYVELPYEQRRDWLERRADGGWSGT